MLSVADNKWAVWWWCWCGRRGWSAGHAANGKQAGERPAILICCVGGSPSGVVEAGCRVRCRGELPCHPPEGGSSSQSGVDYNR